VFCKIADVFDYLGNGIDHSTITRHCGRGRAPAALNGGCRWTRWCRRSASRSAATPRRAQGPLRTPLVELEGVCRRRMPAGKGDLLGANSRKNGHDRSEQGVRRDLRLLQGDGPQAGFPRRSSASPYGISAGTFTKRFPLGQFLADCRPKPPLRCGRSRPARDDINEINIHVSRSAIKNHGPDGSRTSGGPQTHETADHSIPYAAGIDADVRQDRS